MSSLVLHLSSQRWVLYFYIPYVTVFTLLDSNFALNALTFFICAICPLMSFFIRVLCDCVRTAALSEFVVYLLQGEKMSLFEDDDDEDEEDHSSGENVNYSSEDSDEDSDEELDIERKSRKLDAER